MKIRYKAPSGGGTLDLDDNATVSQLLKSLKSATGSADVTVKYGWPPRALNTDQADLTLQSLGLHRESLTVVPAANVNENESTTTTAPSAPADGGASSEPTPPLSEDVIIQMPETNSMLVHRVMPDDNSCLFTAVGGALRGLPGPDDEYPPEKLRRLVAEHIMSNPDKFTTVVLEKTPEKYCANIQRSDTWGGAIELGIISELFNLEVCVVDVKTGRVVRYGEDNHELRCILVYSNIHYDRVAEIFVEGQEVCEFDVTRWSVKNSDRLITHTKAMCDILRDKHYFTDTSDFVVTCNDCGWVGQGQHAVVAHATSTGHTSITEMKLQ